MLKFSSNKIVKFSSNKVGKLRGIYTYLECKHTFTNFFAFREFLLNYCPKFVGTPGTFNSVLKKCAENYYSCCVVRSDFWSSSFCCIY